MTSHHLVILPFAILANHSEIDCICVETGGQLKKGLPKKEITILVEMGEYILLSLMLLQHLAT